MQLPNSKSVQEVALALRTTPSRVLELIASKELPAVNVSKGKIRPRWNIRNEDLENFLRPIAPVSKKKVPQHV